MIPAWRGRGRVNGGSTSSRGSALMRPTPCEGAADACICCLFSTSITQEKVPKVTQLCRSCCGAPGKLKASPVQQPATPALITSSFLRICLKKQSTKLWMPESTANVLAEDPASAKEPLNPFLEINPLPYPKMEPRTAPPTASQANLVTQTKGPGTVATRALGLGLALVSP